MREKFIDLSELLELIRKGNAPTIIKFRGVPYYRDSVSGDYRSPLMLSDQPGLTANTRRNLLTQLAISESLKTTAGGGKKSLDAFWPILDSAEKVYLGHVLKPFRGDVKGIVKRGNNAFEWIRVELIRRTGYEYFTLPTFKAGRMYKGMELDKEYTIGELEL